MKISTKLQKNFQDSKGGILRWGGILTDLEKNLVLKGGYLKRKKYFRPFEGGVFLGREVFLVLPPDFYFSCVKSLENKFSKPQKQGELSVRGAICS